MKENKTITITINENYFNALKEIYHEKQEIAKISDALFNNPEKEEIFESEDATDRFLMEAERLDHMREDLGIKAHVLCGLIYEQYLSNQ